MENNEYPGLFQAADLASVAAQKLYLNSFIVYGGLAVVGAAFSIAGTKSKEAALVASIIFLGGLFVSIYMAFKKNEGIWYRARAVAESVKTATWRFVMGAEPFDMELGDRESQKRFGDLLKNILNEHKDLAHSLADDTMIAEQLSQKMKDIRSLSLEERKNVYLFDRINEQKDWYTKKSKTTKSKGTKCFLALVVVQTLAVVLTLLRIAYPAWQYWPTEIFVVLGACILAWIQLKRYRELSASYSLAAQEIAIAQLSLTGIINEIDFSSFVRDTENAFSREHTQWIAKKE